MSTGEGFLIVYSVASRSSFEEAQDYYRQILRVKGRTHYPAILVANKCDLSKDRAVSKSESIEVAKKFKVPLLETSAKLRINIDECFYSIVKEVHFAN